MDKPSCTSWPAAATAQSTSDQRTILPDAHGEHRNDIVAGFTREYGCHMLVWYEAHDDIEQARLRERRMKEWKRGWKIREIEGLNPDWDDLYERIAIP